MHWPTEASWFIFVCPLENHKQKKSKDLNTNESIYTVNLSSIVLIVYLLQRQTSLTLTVL